MVDLEIDGKPVKVEQGAMVIDAADRLGVYIPRFCYHKKLSIAANCRMCLVEVDKVKKAVPACATPVTEGMKVFTQSEKAREAQQAVMEFLLINHPLDCPICDQGGQCELQDLSMGFGHSESQYAEPKRSVDDEDLGPLIATEMTRCIHCTRCVRFGEEIAGFREMGATGRGENMRVGTYIKQGIRSEVSGNIIDLCPVGALTSKPFRFKARAWELQQHTGVAGHDCLGSNIHIHTLRDKVMRVVPKECEAINETWLSDRDRFSYEGVYHKSRVTKPMIKQDQKWHEVDWQTALQFAASEWGKVLQQHGPSQVAALASPQLTTEELYLAQKLLRALGISNLDHRYRRRDFAFADQDPLAPCSNAEVAEIEKAQTILIVGSYIQQEAPILALRVRKSVEENQAQVWDVNAMAYPQNFTSQHRFLLNPQTWSRQLARLAYACSQAKGMQGAEIDALARHAHIAAEPLSNLENQFAKQFIAAPSALILGASALQHEQAVFLHAVAEWLVAKTSAKLYVISEGANTVGAHLAGFLPHRGVAGEKSSSIGLSASKFAESNLRSYILLNVEPDLDCFGGNQWVAALQQADFNLAVTPYLHDTILQHAHVILPMATYFETPGTYFNHNSQAQAFRAASLPYEESRPAWKIFRVLANLMHLPGFDFADIDQVQQEMHEIMAAAMQRTGMDRSQLLQMIIKNYDPRIEVGMKWIHEWPMYRVDALVRRALPLQHCGSAVGVGCVLAPDVATRFKIQSQHTHVLIKTAQGSCQLPVKIDMRMAEGCGWWPLGFAESAACPSLDHLQMEGIIA